MFTLYFAIGLCILAVITIIGTMAATTHEKRITERIENQRYPGWVCTECRQGMHEQCAKDAYGIKCECTVA